MQMIEWRQDRPNFRQIPFLRRHPSFSIALLIQLNRCFVGLWLLVCLVLMVTAKEPNLLLRTNYTYSIKFVLQFCTQSGIYSLFLLNFFDNSLTSELPFIRFDIYKAVKNPKAYSMTFHILNQLLLITAYMGVLNDRSILPRLQKCQHNFWINSHE